MPTFRDSFNIRFFYIHIPRTAGRFFGEMITSNGFDQEDGDDIVTSHYHRELYEKHLNVKDIPHITVIRNPVDRFFGSSFLLKRKYGENINYILEDIDDCFMILDNFWVGNSLDGVLSTEPVKNKTRYFKPQLDYISSHTNIWKYEDGFGKNFGDWMSDILNMDFKINEVSYPKLKTNENDKVIRNDRIVDNVMIYYRKDMEKFYADV